MEKYQISPIISNSSYNRLFRGHRVKDGELVFVKKSDKNSEINCLPEAHILQQFPPHPWIIQFVELVISSEGNFLVLKDCGKIDLKTYIVKEGALCLLESVRIFNNLCQSVQHLHYHRIVHLGIRPENVVLNSDLDPILCDFSSSLFIDQSKTHKAKILQIKKKYKVSNEKVDKELDYFAPELFLKKPIIHFNNDVWSLGVVFTSLLLGLERKFSKETLLNLINISIDVSSLISSCLNERYLKRPKLEEILTSSRMIELLQSGDYTSKHNSLNCTTIDPKLRKKSLKEKIDNISNLNSDVYSTDICTQEEEEEVSSVSFGSMISVEIVSQGNEKQISSTNNNEPFKNKNNTQKYTNLGNCSSIVTKSFPSQGSSLPVEQILVSRSTSDELGKKKMIFMTKSFTSVRKTDNPITRILNYFK